MDTNDNKQQQSQGPNQLRLLPDELKVIQNKISNYQQKKGTSPAFDMILNKSLNYDDEPVFSSCGLLTIKLLPEELRVIQEAFDELFD
eukprot:COSAG01_NODE_179_length_22923_cov_25.190535_4_plen_88_part_00